MIWFACFVKNSNHLIYRNIQSVVFFRKTSTFDHLSHINFASSSISCLQSIRKHRLIKIWKIQNRKVFSNLRLRKRFALFCLKNRSFHYTKNQTFFTSRCNQDFHQNSHSHDFDLRFRHFFDLESQITFVAFFSIISVFAMICSTIDVLVNYIFRIVDRWEKWKKWLVVSKRNWEKTRNKLLEYSITKHFHKRFIAYTFCWMQCTHQLSHVRKYRYVNRCCVDSINMTKLFVSSCNRFDVAKIQRLH